MAFTYDGDPADKAGEAVRFLCGDTTQRAKSLADAEIAYALSIYGISGGFAVATFSQPQVQAAARDCAEVLAARYAEEASYSVGGTSESANHKALEYAKTARRLKRLLDQTALPQVGGRVKATKDADAADTSRVQPAFFKEMMSAQGSALSPTKAEDC